MPMTQHVLEQLALGARAFVPGMLAQLRTLVETESPTEQKTLVDRAGEQVATWAAELGGKVRVHRFKGYGNSLEIDFRPVKRASQAPTLLLGHLDTVWPEGTLRTMPWLVKGDKVHGPGVLDMKAGVVMMLAAVRMLREADALTRPVKLLLHGEEEVGSPVSRPLTEKIAPLCQSVYVLEPAQGPEGAYKTARKGVGYYKLSVTGIAAHSGVDFTTGHSAILELGRQIEKISALTDLAKGITLNPGVIGGGTRSNVIAAEAWAEIDLRIARARDAQRIDRALQRLRPHDRACSLTLEGGLNRPPMERTKAIAALFLQAQKLAGQIGFSLDEAATGGGSDGNFTAGLGVPTLDGMGAVGEGAHAAHEHLRLSYLAPRTALLAAMLL